MNERQKVGLASIPIMESVGKVGLAWKGDGG